MDVAYINPFIAATKNVFDTMVHVPFMLGRPHLREGPMSSATVAATIQLSGPVDGAVILCLPQAVALALASGLIGSPVKTVDADCLDALGEITNMIAGNAKKDFPDQGVKLSTPKLVTPDGVRYPDNIPVIVIPCVTGKGKLAIEVAIKTPPRKPAEPVAVQ